MKCESLIILIAMLSNAESTPGDCRRKLDQMNQDLYDKRLLKDAQSLGFMYEGTNTKPTCGVALVLPGMAITDGSCVPEETDLSQIQILFRVVEENTISDVYHVLRRANYKSNNVNIAILIMNRLTPSIEGYIWPWQPRALMPKIEGIFRHVGWDKDWKVTSHDVTISRIDADRMYVSPSAEYECPEQYRGQLLLEYGEIFTGISILWEYPTKHIAYLNIWEHCTDLINFIFQCTPRLGTELYEIIRKNTQEYWALQNE